MPHRAPLLVKRLFLVAAMFAGWLLLVCATPGGRVRDESPAAPSVRARPSVDLKSETLSKIAEVAEEAEEGHHARRAVRRGEAVPDAEHEKEEQRDGDREAPGR